MADSSTITGGAPASVDPIVEGRYPFVCNDYYWGLIDRGAADDPIARQCLPDRCELERFSGHEEDFLGEQSQSPVPFLVHRYPDRVVLLATNQCPVLCRFCFRKRLWGKPDAAPRTPSEADLERITAYLRGRRDVREALISGGDPLTLDDGQLAKVIAAVRAAPRVSVLRIATRSPATFPARVTPELAAMLAAVPGLWVVTHFNHPRELSADSAKACRLLVGAGVPTLNQTVLLAGVNDDADTLEELFRGLAAWRVKPHYLFHVDPVAGAAHFATGVARGLEIMRELRGRLSSVATPTFAIDLPEGGGKVPLQPNYQTDGGGYQTIQGGNVKYPFD